MEIKMVDIDLIKADPKQPRQTFEDIEQLAETAKTKGIIQPLIVRKAEVFYYIIDGERRWRAAKIAKLDKIPCLIRPEPFTETDILEMQLIIALQTDNISPEEIAPKVVTLMELKKWDQKIAAISLGVSKATIQDYIILDNSTKEEKGLITLWRKSDGEKGMSPSTITEVKETVKDDKKKENLYKHAKGEVITRKTVREMMKPKEEKEIGLPFRLFHKDLILKGKKIQTSRYKLDSRITEGKIINMNIFEPKVAKIKILKIEQRKLNEFTEEDAKREGATSLSDFKDVWRKIQGKWNPEDKVKVIRFELVE